MGLPSGVLWAPCNIDVSQPNGFAKSPYQYDFSYFSWGNVDGHNPTGPSSFSPWSWGASNANPPYVDSPGSLIVYPDSVDLAHDAARIVCGSPWRLPTGDDFSELFDNCDYIDANGEVIDVQSQSVIITINDVLGIRLRSRINGAVLFLNVTGLGFNTQLTNRLVYGNYWSSDLATEANGLRLQFSASGANVAGAIQRFYGLAIRPVMTVA